jgi:hypothetical protein
MKAEEKSIEEVGEILKELDSAIDSLSSLLFTTPEACEVWRLTGRRWEVEICPKST